MADAIPLGEFAEKVRLLYAARRPLTRQKMAQVLRELEVTLGRDALTTDLTTERMGLWLALYGSPRDPGTVAGQISYIRAACAWAVEEGWLDRPPAWKRIRPKVGRRRVGPHQSLEEVRRLLAHLEACATAGAWKEWRLYALVATAVYTALRRAELLFLRVEDVDLVGRIVAVVPIPARLLKTPESEEPVPIPAPLAPIIEGWLEVRRTGDWRAVRTEWLWPGQRGRCAWNGGKCGSRPIDALRNAGKAVGIDPEKLSWQSLRRSWATHAETAWGLTEPQIQRILRHTSPETSRRHYRAADLANLREIAGRVAL